MPQNKSEDAAGQNNKSGFLSALPFGGKWAAILLAAVLVLAFAAAVVPRLFACDIVMDIPPWQCAGFDESAGFLPQARFMMLAAAGVLLLWLAASMAVFIIQWARDLPLGGGLALLLLVAIGGGDLLVRDTWQGYAGSALDKITDYVFAVLIFWIAAALCVKKIKERRESAMQKAMQAPATMAKAAKETFGGAVQTVKSAAGESAGKITRGFNNAAGAAKETADKSVDKITEGLGKTTEAVKGTADNIADSAKGLYRRTSSAMGEGIDTAAKGIGDAATSAKDAAVSAKNAVAKVPGQVISTAENVADITGEKATSLGRRIKETASDIGESMSDAAAKLGTRAKKILTRTPQEPDKNNKS